MLLLQPQQVSLVVSHFEREITIIIMMVGNRKQMPLSSGDFHEVKTEKCENRFGQNRDLRKHARQIH